MAGEAFIVNVRQDCWFGHSTKAVSDTRIAQTVVSVTVFVVESNDVDASSLLLLSRVIHRLLSIESFNDHFSLWNVESFV